MTVGWGNLEARSPILLMAGQKVVRERITRGRQRATSALPSRVNVNGQRKLDFWKRHKFQDRVAA
eukprot:scaffold4513_cov269-Ochromonas_danica.AAC.3